MISSGSPSVVILAYNAFVLAVPSGLLFLASRSRRRDSLAPFLISGGILLVASLIGAVISPIGRFGRVQLLAWAMFLHHPLFLLITACFLYGPRRRFALAFGALAGLIIVVAVDAFLIEPRWLEVTRVTIPSTKLEHTVRVAVVADLQTDDLGRYEKRVLQRVQAEKPDLVLFVGDYLDVLDAERYVTLSGQLNTMLRDLDAPSLGMYAVRGNVDWPGTWQRIFTGLSARTFDRSRTVDVGPLAVTGLTLEDASNVNPTLEGESDFHIVLGHSPNFSLGQVDADLLVAGHTHGGQVQLPFLGPIVTLSQVPRSWASGVTEIGPGKTLIVPRGIGMERGHAPRMRFLCRPQLIIVELVPSRARSEHLGDGQVLGRSSSS